MQLRGMFWTFRSVNLPDKDALRAWCEQEPDLEEISKMHPLQRRYPGIKWGWSCEKN